MNISGIELTPRQAYDVYQFVKMQQIKDEAEHKIAFAVDDLVDEGACPNDYVITEQDKRKVVDWFITTHNRRTSEDETWKTVIEWWKNDMRLEAHRYFGMNYGQDWPESSYVDMCPSLREET